MIDPFRLVEYRDTLDALLVRKEALRREFHYLNSGIAEGRAQWTANYEETKQIDERIRQRMEIIRAQSFWIDPQEERMNQKVADHPFMPDAVAPLCALCDEPDVRHRFQTAVREAQARGEGA